MGDAIYKALYNSSRTTIIVYYYAFEDIAKSIKEKCQDSILLSIANVDRAIIGDARHATNLGDQMASEIFASAFGYTNLDIIMIGAGNLYLADRKGMNEKFTEHFWDSFISALNVTANNNRLILYSRKGNGDVDKMLLSLSDTLFSVDFVNGSLDYYISNL